LIPEGPKRDRVVGLAKPPTPGMVTSWEIKYDELEIISEIGKGGFGIVYLGKWRETPVAIKSLINVEPRERAAFQQEANVMKSLRPHANVLLFQGLCLNQNQIMIVTEFMPGGNLWSLLTSDKKIDRTLTFKFLKGIAAGMMHLSSEGLVHRDLAARNILLTLNLEAKVADFGMSRILTNNESSKTASNIGPLRWMAPESLSRNEYSSRSDVWSFGVLVYEILARDTPYKEMTAAQVAIGISN